jgi:hypothetical protein
MSMLEEGKSYDHTYSVGDRVFDLPSRQMVTILKIELVEDGGATEQFQSVNPSNEFLLCGDDAYYFVVTVDAPADFPGVENFPGGQRVITEFCLPEEAERYRGFDCIPS